MKINIVMVEPEIPQNTGNIARTCAATGAKLHLVKPLGFSIDDKYLKRAGLDYWDKLEIEIHESLHKFLEKYIVGVGVHDDPIPNRNTQNVGADDPTVYTDPVTGEALTGIMRVCPINNKKIYMEGGQSRPPLHIQNNIPINMFLASTKSKQTYVDVDYTKFDEIFILFGKETKGLPEDLIENNMKQAIRIPMREGLRSLNLSNSVAIVVYEVLRQNNFNDLQQISEYFN